MYVQCVTYKMETQRKKGRRRKKERKEGKKEKKEGIKGK